MAAPKSKAAKDVEARVEKSKGGRPAGSIAKRTLDLMSEFERHHFNVVDEAVSTYKAARQGAAEFDSYMEQIVERLEKAGGSGRIILNIRDPRPDYLKVAEHAISNLMQYVYPKRKAVELTGADGKDLVLSFTDLMRRAATDDPKSK